MEDGRDAATLSEDSFRNVLIVVDDGQTRDMIRRALTRAGFTSRSAISDPEAMSSVAEFWPDLVILNSRIAADQGRLLFEVIRASSDVPIVMLSPTGDANERARALESGADDFVPTPIWPEELVARVRSVLRRARSPSSDTTGLFLAAGPLLLHEQTRRVRLRGRWVVLTAREFSLLHFLAARPNQTFSKAALLDHVWGYAIGDASTVTVHVRRLREKIEPDPAKPVLIMTVWGSGYRFDPALPE